MTTTGRKSRASVAETTGSLAGLGRGEGAEIVGFSSDDATTRRLCELGFTPGNRATLQRSAPLRDPLLFDVGGTSIVLRRTEAQLVLVQP